MTVEHFNSLSFEDARSAMLDCCGSEAWAVEMAARRPYESLEAVIEAADAQWWHLGEFGWLEAFRAYAHNRPVAPEWTEALLHHYYATFGFDFVLEKDVPDEDVVEALTARIENRPEQELANAAEEQARITRSRLVTLFQS